jgi:hypothetical protein
LVSQVADLILFFRQISEQTEGIGLDTLSIDDIQWTHNFTFPNDLHDTQANGSTKQRPSSTIPVRPMRVPTRPLAAPFSSPVLGASPKKGVGWSRWDGRNVSVLNSLNVSWYYSWGTTEASGATSIFIPMAYSERTIPRLPAFSPIVLGFNEPDHPKQSNMTVFEAAQFWPTLRSKAGKLGSPAMAGNPVSKGSWLESFMSQMENYTEFVAVHWYKGVNASRFKSDVQSVCNKFRKPVWVTEFAPQTYGNALVYPNRYSLNEVISFMTKVTKWMNNNSCVSAYAWHDPRHGTSALYSNTSLNSLSETGKAYAAIN